MSIQRLAQAIDGLIQRRATVRLARVIDPKLDSSTLLRFVDYVVAEVSNSPVNVLVDRYVWLNDGDQIYIRPVGTAADRRWVYVGIAHRSLSDLADPYTGQPTFGGGSGVVMAAGAQNVGGPIDINTGTTGVIDLDRLPLVLRDIALTQAQAGGTQKATFTGDGATTVFTLPSTPLSGTEEVFRNGLEQEAGVDYTISGAVLTMLVVLGVGEVLAVNYET